jgi:hypothetical protein
MARPSTKAGLMAAAEAEFARCFGFVHVLAVVWEEPS